MGTEGPRGSRRPPCGGCLRLCIDDQESDAESLREMRAGVRLCAGVGRSWLLRTVLRPRWDLEVLLRAALCCAEGLRGVAALLLTAEGCALAALCARSEGQAARVCGRPCGRVCRARGRSVRGRRDALAPAAGLAKRRPVCGQRHRGHCSRGCRHRGTGQPASLRRSRIQRGTAAAHRGVLEVLPWQDAVSI